MRFFSQLLATRKLVVAVAIAASVGLWGCAASDADLDAAVTASCQGAEQQDCEALDNERQLRDAADYKDEPALGYLQSPPGMLPVPLTSRNTTSN